MSLRNIYTLLIVGFAVVLISSCKEDKKESQEVAGSEIKTTADTTIIKQPQKDSSILINDSLKNVLSNLSLKQLKKEYLPILKSIDEEILLLQRLQIQLQQQSKGIDDIETIRKIMITEGNAVKIKTKVNAILEDYNKIKPQEQNQTFNAAMNEITSACSGKDKTWEEQCFGNINAKTAIAILESWVLGCKKAQNEVISKTLK